MGVTIAGDWVWAKGADDLRWIPFKAQDTIAVARLKSKDDDYQLAMEQILTEIIENMAGTLK